VNLAPKKTESGNCCFSKCSLPKPSRGSNHTPVPFTLSGPKNERRQNSEDSEKGKKSSDTMGMKHRVDKGTYVFFGSINHQLSTLTGFTDKDAEKLKETLISLFENDASSARPDGSMEVKNVVWWQHSCASGDVSSAKVHGSLTVEEDGTVIAPDIHFKRDEKELLLKLSIKQGF
jgi:CRISPR-associated protein Csd2